MATPLTGQLKLKNGEYQVRLSVYVGPKQRRRDIYKLGTADLELAERKLARLLAELRLKERNDAAIVGAVAAPTPAVSIGDSPTMPRFEAYARSVHEKRKADGVAMVDSELSNLERHIFPADVGEESAPLRFGDILLGDVRVRHVLRLLERVRDKGLSKGTVQHVRAVVRRVMQAAVEAELVRDNVVAKVRTPKVRGEVAIRKRRSILSDAEIEQFFVCNVEDLEIQMLGLVSRVEGGQRTRDLTAWRWSMIDTQRFASCFVPRTKTQAPQELSIPEVLQAPLRSWWVAHGSPKDGPVFPITRGEHRGEARPTRGVSFAKRLRRALMKAKVKRHACEHPDVAPTKVKPCCAALALDPLYRETDVSLPVDFHSFRRAFSTALAEAGVNAQQAMVLAGHADPRAHGRYIMATREMGRIPSAAVPRLRRNGIQRDRAKESDYVEGEFHNVFAMLPERDTRFELATLSLGS